MMSYSYGITLLILCPLIFLAAFIDSIAGGGGLISLPAYLLAGLPIHTAHGTNKFTASMGTAVAMVNYVKNRCVDFRSAIAGSIFALLGSWLGTNLALYLSPRALQMSLVFILPLAGLFILVRGNRGPGRGAAMQESVDAALEKSLSPGTKLIISALIGLVIGAYDGFFGPGTGMFMTLAFTFLIRMELLKAAGTARAVNLSSNVASLLTWLRSGNVLFPVAIPCMLCAMAGGFLGSRLAIRVGKKFIRIVLIVAALLLFARVLFDLISALTL